VNATLLISSISFLLFFRLQAVLCQEVHIYKDSNDLTLDSSSCCYSFSSLEAMNSPSAKMLILAEFVLYSSYSPKG